MLNWRQLARQSNDELASLDIAEVHLACAADLPDSERIDCEGCIRKIDELSCWVERYTKHCLEKRSLVEKVEKGLTENQDRMNCLTTVLWKGAGIRYNPAKIAADAPLDFDDAFIPAALFGPGGTCATLPILYIAIGRRLGYPLKLVTAWGPKSLHLFCRWDDPHGERFNVDVNFTGVCFPTDAYHRRHGQDPDREKAGLFLKSKSPREELACFLVQRAFCWRQAGNLRECVEAFAWASSLSPDNAYLLNGFIEYYEAWFAEVKAREPRGFPQVLLDMFERRFPEGLSLEFEQNIIYLTLLEILLKDQKANILWWEPLRRGQWWVETPRSVQIVSWRDRLDWSFQYSV